MKLLLRLLLFLLIYWSIASSESPLTDTTTTSFSTLEYGFAQIEWLRSQPGGYVHPAVEVRQLWDAPNAALGVYSTQDLQRGTVLMILPQDALLTSGGSGGVCGTARKLLREYKKGNTSAYAPYVQYLFARPHGQLPSAWSELAQYTIRKIIGNEEHPFEVAGLSFEDDCDGSEDPLADHAYLSVIQRCWIDKCLPVFDMCNHRNGKWRNVDSTSAHNGKPITVFAIRDIQADEQLYLSYNECTDCQGFAYTFVTPHLLKNFGFVEEYPQRWLFRDQTISFQIDQVDEHKPEKLELTWISDRPTTTGLNHLRGHLKRLESLKQEVDDIVSHLESRHEKDVILGYYESITKAIKLAIDYEEPDPIEVGVCEVTANGETGTCTSPKPQPVYDPLDNDLDEEPDEDSLSCHWQHGTETVNREEYYQIDQTESFYQLIAFFHNVEKGDTCLELGPVVHSCLSYRPFYHEEIVHYPARYLQDVRRAIYIGGGDSMILPELLKYPNIELIVGLELDQQVVRSSFKNYGTLPHFDNSKVQWWFGDAAKSLLMIPKEYYGSFDLVMVDLLNEVIDYLTVTENITIMDAALLLLAPGGIIMRNEDVDTGVRSGQTYTDYSVNLYHHGLPIQCDQSFIMGSNSVDFLHKTPIDHQIKTMFEPAGNVSDRFGLWYDYRKNVDKVQLCKEGGSDDTVIPDPNQMVHGILMIIEAENAELPRNSLSSIHSSIRKALKRAGLTDLSGQSSSTVLEENEEVYTFVFIMREGYVIARAWPEDNYCAFDLLLWSGFDKQEVAKEELLQAVGSKPESPSSYRIITGGMFGLDNLEDDLQKIGPRYTQLCHHHIDQEETDNLPEVDVVETILQESVSLIRSTNVVVVVLCGESSESCRSFDVMSKMAGIRKIIPVLTCPSVLQNESVTSEVLAACESEILHQLKDAVASDSLIDGIIIDPAAVLPTGQVLHRILQRKRNRRELLQESFVAIGINESQNKSSWSRYLLNRFQKEIVVFDPAYKAEILFGRSSMQLGIFSAGDANFYSNLVDMLARIEVKTRISADVQEVTNGRMNYIADFKPDYFFTYKDFDMNATIEQWMSQYATGRQIIFQFEQQANEGVVETPLSSQGLKGVLESAIEAMELPVDDDESDDFLVQDYIGEGCAIAAIWSGGNVILVWDGRSHVDVNLFTHAQDRPIHTQFSSYFMESLTHFSLVARDDQPRGFGRVVLFSDEMEEEPYWLDDLDEDE